MTNCPHCGEKYEPDASFCGKCGSSILVKNGNCQLCGDSNTVSLAKYAKHTGMLIIGKTETITGYFCRKCNGTLFRNCMTHCVLAGWWGATSIIFHNPAVIIGNTVMYFKANSRFDKAQPLLHN
jgi:hypothetical protein